MAVTTRAQKVPVVTSFSPGTIAGKADPDIVGAINRMATYVNQLQARIADLEKQLAAMPAPLTMDQIQADLSSTGSHPLNLTGLRGQPNP